MDQLSTNHSMYESSETARVRYASVQDRLERLDSKMERMCTDLSATREELVSLRELMAGGRITDSYPVVQSKSRSIARQTAAGAVGGGLFAAVIDFIRGLL